MCHIIVGNQCEKTNIFEDHLWFRRAISKLRYWYCERFHLDLQGTERAVYVKCLDPLLFTAKGNANPYLTTLKVLYPNVDIYNQKLAWLNYHLVKGEDIPNQWCHYRYSEILLSSFFVNEQGRHLDPIRSLSTFQENALLFLQRTEALPGADSGAAEHNARVLAQFRKHLLEVFRTLIHYTHHD